MAQGTISLLAYAPCTCMHNHELPGTVLLVIREHLLRISFARLVMLRRIHIEGTLKMFKDNYLEDDISEEVKARMHEIRTQEEWQSIL